VERKSEIHDISTRGQRARHLLRRLAPGWARSVRPKRVLDRWLPSGQHQYEGDSTLLARRGGGEPSQGSVVPQWEAAFPRGAPFDKCVASLGASVGHGVPMARARWSRSFKRRHLGIAGGSPVTPECRPAPGTIGRRPHCKWETDGPVESTRIVGSRRGWLERLRLSLHQRVARWRQPR
jgi:hypothetical protein